MAKLLFLSSQGSDSQANVLGSAKNGSEPRRRAHKFRTMGCYTVGLFLLGQVLILMGKLLKYNTMEFKRLYKRCPWLLPEKAKEEDDKQAQLKSWYLYFQGY